MTMLFFVLIRGSHHRKLSVRHSNMMPPKYSIEHSPGTKSTCQGHCHELIEKNALRLGSIAYQTDKSVYVFWRHWSCATKRVMENIRESGGIDLIKGFDSLTDGDKAQVKKDYENLLNSKNLEKKISLKTRDGYVQLKITDSMKMKKVSKNQNKISQYFRTSLKTEKQAKIDFSKRFL